MQTQIVPQRDTGLLPRFLIRYASQNTRRAYARDIVAFFGVTEITEALVAAPGPEHVSAWLRGLEADGLAAATVERKLAAVRSFYNWCQASEVVDRNPCDRYLVGRPKKGRERHVLCLSRQEARQVIDACSGATGARDRLLIECLLYLALRRSEAAGLNVEDFRSSGPYWVVQLRHTKSGEDDWVKAPPELVESMQHFARQQGIERGALFRSMSTNDSRGKRITPSGVYKAVRRIARRAGLNFAPHTLRHTACTLAIEGGASLQQVKDHARHRDLSTTLTYIHQRDRLRDSGGDYIRL